MHLLGSRGEGGAQTYFVDLVTALSRAGVTQSAVIGLNPERCEALDGLGVDAAVAPFGGLFDFVTAARVGAMARRTQARVVVQWMNRAGRFLPPGPWARIGRLGGYYKLKYYRGCDLLVANTADIARWVVEQGWPADKVAHIPNFAAAGLGPAQDRAALDTPADAPLLLALGRLHPSKGHDVTLRALRELPRAWLWIAGDGPLEAPLKALAGELGVAERVRFLGWRHDVSALYRAADVCVFPSRFEPLGNVVLQAWAHHLPLVAAAAAGPAALVTDEVDGLLTPVDDVAALGFALRRLIDDPALGRRLAQAGAARLADGFSEAAIVARWREIFARFGEA